MQEGGKMEHGGSFAGGLERIAWVEICKKVKDGGREVAGGFVEALLRDMDDTRVV